MKKFGGLLLLSIFLLSISIGLVSAETFGNGAVGQAVANALDTAYEALKPIFEGLLGETPSGDLSL